jgi:hypothetical protein
MFINSSPLMGFRLSLWLEIRHVAGRRSLFSKLRARPDKAGAKGAAAPTEPGRAPKIVI